MPETATSLRLETGSDPASPTLAELTWDLVDAVEGELTHLGDAGYAVAAYRELSVHQPGERLSVAAGEEVVEGSFAGIDDQGSLLLESGGRERRLSAGEIIEG
jgi:biotin-(acetyl-CoA carboxylase) ligase